MRREVTMAALRVLGLVWLGGTLGGLAQMAPVALVPHWGGGPAEARAQILISVAPAVLVLAAAIVLLLWAPAVVAALFPAVQGRAEPPAGVAWIWRLAVPLVGIWFLGPGLAGTADAIAPILSVAWQIDRPGIPFSSAVVRALGSGRYEHLLAPLTLLIYGALVIAGRRWMSEIHRRVER